jgi:hypothetical protein
MFVTIDFFCERRGPGLWQEPLNLAASVMLAIAALWLARRLRDNPPYARLALVLAMVGAAAVLVHLWPALAVHYVALGAIVIFALLALYRITLDLVGLRRGQAILITTIFLPFSLAAMPVLAMTQGALGSLGLVPYPILLLGIAAVLRQHSDRLAGEVLLAGAGLGLAIALRGLDRPLCGVWPSGTHFLYILLASAVLLRLVAVAARHALAARG